MEAKTKPIVVLALLAMLHWLFGNLYEAVVISPNWVVDAPQQVARLNALFVRTSPTLYFVPITFFGPIFTWVAWAIHRSRELRHASVFAVLATLVNGFIVATIITRLFGDVPAEADVVHALCVRWNVLNAVRMALTAATVGWLFAAFRRLDRLPAGA